MIISKDVAQQRRAGHRLKMPSRVQPWRRVLGLRKPQGLLGFAIFFPFLLFFLGVLTGSIRFAHRACAALVSALRVTIPNAKARSQSPFVMLFTLVGRSVPPPAELCHARNPVKTKPPRAVAARVLTSLLEHDAQCRQRNDRPTSKPSARPYLSSRHDAVAASRLR